MEININTLKDTCLKVLDDQKAEDINIIDLSNKNSIADYVLIASGTSSRHVLTLKDKIVQEVKKNNLRPSLVEGEDTANWIIVDLNSIIIHLFRKEVREYYEFDDIWK